MKKLIILSLLAISVQAKENCKIEINSEGVIDYHEIKTDVPSYLKGATIIIRQADGKESQVPAERFKVVPRIQQFIASKKVVAIMQTCKVDDFKHRASVLGGYGSQNGTEAKVVSPTTVEVSNKVGLSAGLQYQYKVTDKVSAGVQVQSNKTGSVLLGLDF